MMAITEGRIVSTNYISYADKWTKCVIWQHFYLNLHNKLSQIRIYKFLLMLTRKDRFTRLIIAY